MVAGSPHPAWKHLSGGCRLNRAISELIQNAGFRIERLDTGYMPGPKPMTSCTRVVRSRNERSRAAHRSCLGGARRPPNKKIGAACRASPANRSAQLPLADSPASVARSDQLFEIEADRHRQTDLRAG